MEWFNWKKSQILTSKRPATVDDLQADLKKGLKSYTAKKLFDQPFFCSLARDIYSDQVVNWCVNWLKQCKFPGYDVQVSLDANEWTIFVTFTKM